MFGRRPKDWMRLVAREAVPPVVGRVLRSWVPRAEPARFQGDYNRFEDARAAATPGGYEAAVQAIHDQTAAIRSEVAKQPARALNAWVIQNLAAMRTGITVPRGGRLRVLDFGGGMGVHYFTLAPLLADWQLNWTICETKATAQAGEHFFGDSGVTFIDEVDKAESRYDVVLASGVLQYLERPVEVLKRLQRLTDVLIANRFPLIEQPDRLTVQAATMGGQLIKYPAWFFCEKKWMPLFEADGFRIRLRWTDSTDTVVIDGRPVDYGGLLTTRPERA